MNFVTLVSISNQTVVIIPRYSGQVLRLGSVEVVTVAEQPARVYGTGVVEVSEGYWDLCTVVDGNYDGPAFDGGTPDDGDIFHQWSGGANSSTSTRSIRNFLPVSEEDTPHTVIEVDDLDPGVAFITVWRDDGTRWVEVRAAVMVAVVGAWAGVDWECGFNRATAYRVEQFDSGGLSLGFLPAVTVTLASEWTCVQNVLAPKDAVRVMFTSKALETVDRPYDAEIVYPRGASYGTVVGSARRGVTGVNLEMVTDTLRDADRVQALLGSPGNELPPVLCVRKGANEGSARIPHTMFVHTPSIVEVDFTVRYGGESVIHQAVGTEVRPPAKRIGTPLLTRADLSAAYATRAARSADNISRAAASRRWDLAGFANV